MVTEAKRSAAEQMLSAMPAPAGEAGWAREARAAARTRLLESGAPVRRDEYWKYTDPAALTTPLRLADGGVAADRSRDPFTVLTDRVALFVGGKFRADLSAPLSQPGLAVATLGETLAQDISVMREIYGVLEAAGQEKVDRPLASLNTAASTEGLALQATGPGGVIHLRYDNVVEGAAMVRHLIRVEEGAELTVLESGVAANTVIEADIADGGKLRHIRLQNEDRVAIATHLFAKIGSEAEFKTFTLSADGGLTRNEVVIEMTGDNGRGHIAGAVLAQGESHIDNTVFVTHDGVACESRQVFKNVLGGRAKGIFQGKIFVRDGAQKTDGYQISQAVLLDDGAEFSAKPELEIYADDVACSHGSTTGALDPAALFYLRSRGVPQKAAEAMLIAAFAEEAIEEIDDDNLADAMRAEVERWMAGRG